MIVLASLERRPCLPFDGSARARDDRVVGRGKRGCPRHPPQPPSLAVPVMGVRLLL